MECRFCGSDLEFVSMFQCNHLYKCVKCEKLLLTAIQHDVTDTFKKIWFEEDIRRDFSLP